MKHHFTVYTDSGLPDSLSSAVQLVFTLSPSVHGPETRSHRAVVCKTMRFGMNGTRPSSNVAASSHGVHEEFLWEWETIFAFSKYESINRKQRRLVGELWPTSPGQSRTIGNMSIQERSTTISSSESVLFSQTVEDEWTTFGSSTLGSSALGSGSSTFGSSKGGSSHADRSSSSKEQARTTEIQTHEDWGRPQSYYDLNPLNDASVVAINDSGKSQNVALYIRNPSDQIFDTIAVYDSVHHGEKIVASSFLVLQAYIVVGRDVQEYDLAEGLGSPIFTEPLACDSIPPSSKWRLCMDDRRKIRLIMDDLDLWCMKKTVETLWRTVDGMKTQVTDVTVIKETLSNTETKVTSLDERLTTAESCIKTNFQDSNTRFARLEETVGGHSTELVRLPALEKRASETHEKLTATQRSVEETRSKVQGVEVRVDALESQRSRADQEMSKLQTSLNSTNDRVTVIEKSQADTREGLSGVIEKTFRDSKEIRTNLESRIEKQCTNIVNSTMETRLSVIEKKTVGVKETVHDTIREVVATDVAPQVSDLKTGAQKIDTRIIKVETRLDSVVKTVDDNHTRSSAERERHVQETKKNISLVEDSVHAVEVRVSKVEIDLSELEQIIPRKVVETVHNNQEIREKMETTVRDSRVIREIMNQNTRDVLTADIEPRLLGVENLIEVMEPRLVTVETDIKGMKNTLSSGVESRLSVVEKKTHDVKDTVQSTIRDVLASDVNHRFLEINTKTDGMGTRLSAVETKTEGAEKRISLSETRVEALNKTVNDHHTESSTSLSSLKTRVDKTERTLSESVNKVEVRVEKVETSLSKLQQTITGTIVETVQNNKEIREKMETTVRDSQVIRDVMNKNTRDILACDVEPKLLDIKKTIGTMEPRLTFVETEVKGMKNTLSSGVESRLLVVEKKTHDVRETVQGTIRDALTSDVIPRIVTVETGAKDTNTRITQSDKRVDALDKWVDEKFTELTTGLVKHTEETKEKISQAEKSIHTVDAKVEKVEVRVEKVETDLSKLQRTIRDTIVETVRDNQEIRDKIETTTRDSQVIREVMTKNTRDILASDVEPRLSGVETLIEVMEPRLVIVETEVKGVKNTLASGVESRLRVVETGAEATKKRISLIDNRVDMLEKTTKDNHILSTNGLSSLETRVDKTEGTLSIVRESAKETKVRVEKVETSLSELQKSIPRTIADSFHDSKELQEKIETTTRESKVIREVIVKNTRDILASDIEPRLSGVENLIEAMEPRLVTVETDIKGMKNTLTSAVESRLSVVERKTLDVTDTVQRTIRDILVSDVDPRFLDLRNKFSESSSQTQAHVTALQQKLASVETSANSTQKEVSQLQKSVTDFGAAIGANRNNIMDVHRAVEAAANKLTSIRHEIDELKKYSNSDNNDKLFNLETRVHSMDSRVVEITTQIGGLSESLSQTREQMGTFITDARKDTEELSAKLGERLAPLEKRVQTTEGRVTSTEGRVESVENVMGNVNISIVDIQQTIESHGHTKADKSQVDLLEQHIAQTKKEMEFLAELKTDVRTLEKTLTTEVKTCQTDVATCQADVTDCRSKVTICQAEVADCQSDVAAYQSALRACQSNVATCQSDVAACQGIVANCQSDLTVVGTEVKDLSTTTKSALSGHQTSITNTNADVTRLEESVAQLRASTVTGDRVSEMSDELRGRLATAEEQLRTRLTKVQTTMESRTKHTHEILLKTRQDLSIVHQIAIGGQRQASRVNTLAERKSGVHQALVGEHLAECTAEWHRTESNAHATQESTRQSSVSGGYRQTSSTTSSISGGRSGATHSGPRVYAL